MDLGPTDFDEDDQRYPDSPRFDTAGVTPETGGGPVYGPPGTGVPPGYTQEFRAVPPPQHEQQPPAPPAPPTYQHHPYPWLHGVPPQMAAAQANQTIVNLHARKRVNHALHATLTLVTCGLWAPVWAFVAITAPKQ